MSDIVAIDYESFGTSEDAVVLSMGVAIFKEEWLNELVDDFSEEKCTELFCRMIDDGLYLKFNVAEQIKKYKRAVDKDTIDWWMKQGDSAQDVLKPDSSVDISIYEMENSLQEYFKDKTKPKLVYSRGTVDMTWYQSILNRSLKVDISEKQKTFPWWSNRDIRTVIDECLEQSCGKLPKNLSGFVKMDGKFIKHNSLHDSAVDCMNIVIARLVRYGLGEE